MAEGWTCDSNIFLTSQVTFQMIIFNIHIMRTSLCSILCDDTYSHKSTRPSISESRSRQSIDAELDSLFPIHVFLPRRITISVDEGGSTSTDRPLLFHDSSSQAESINGSLIIFIVSSYDHRRHQSVLIRINETRYQFSCCFDSRLFIQFHLLIIQ